MKQSRIYKPVSTLLIGFWSCCHRSGRAHRDCNIIYQFLWGYVHSYQDSPNLQQRQTVVHCKTQTAPSAQRRCSQEWGQKYTLEKEIRVAKRNYFGKLRNQLSSSDPASVWKGLKDITNYKTHPPALWRINNWQTIWMSFIAGLKKHHSHLLQPPSPLLLHCRSVKMMCVRSSERTREGRHQAQTVWHQPVWKPVLTSWPPSSHRSSTDHWSCAKSPHASNAPLSSLSQRNPKLLDLMTTDLWL